MRMITIITAVVAMTPTMRMVTIVAALFIIMKMAVFLATPTRLSPVRALAFLAWPGMRPSTFAGVRRPSAHVVTPLLIGTGNLAAGAALFALARFAATRSVAMGVLLAFPALSLILHFGVFDLATAFWRAIGFPAEDLFRQPWRSRSLADFWSRRWNVGFSDMMSVLVHRPFARRFGRAAGVAAAFVASGLLHELAISVPAGGGYGLPTTYFLIHGALVAADVRGRLVTLLSLAAPLPLLFHAPFVRAIVIPLLLR